MTTRADVLQHRLSAAEEEKAEALREVARLRSAIREWGMSERDGEDDRRLLALLETDDTEGTG